MGWYTVGRACSLSASLRVDLKRQGPDGPYGSPTGSSPVQNPAGSETRRSCDTQWCARRKKTCILTFDDLQLDSTLRRGIADMGFDEPTPIQSAALPQALAGRDILGTAMTGSGKTAAFVLPILQRLLDSAGTAGTRALVLTPTRELAAQIAESFRSYTPGGRIRCEVVFGGVGKRPQVTALRRGVDVLDGVSFAVEPGEVVGLLGTNGAGKTTLLRVAMGLQQPTSGDIFLRPDLRIGYLPQKLNIDPTFPLTVRRFLAMANQKDPALAVGVVEALEEVGVSYVIDSPLQRLSGGEFQRVLLARAIIRRPELLVLDEPLQGVDAHGQLELYQLISRIRERYQCAILMVSHDLHLVMASTDRVLCLNRHVCCSGSPEAVTNDPAFQELFSPQTIGHLAIYSHDKTHVHKDCAVDRETGDVR